MMNCRNCGNEIADTVKFCPDCGEKVLYEIEVIEVDDHSIVSIKNDVNKDQNKKVLVVQDGFFAKLKIKYENLNIAIKFIIWIILIISCLCIYTDYNQRQEKKEQEKLQVEMDVKYSDGMENLSKGDFINAENCFSAFSGNFRINTDATDYVIGDKHYKNANVLRLYAVAGREFQEGVDPSNSLDKIPNNYIGLFNQEINNLKIKVKETKEKIAAEKEAAEREKKRKEEEERERKKREEFLRLRASLPTSQKILGHWVSNDWLNDCLITPDGKKIDKSCTTTPWHYYISEQMFCMTENEKVHRFTFSSWEDGSENSMIASFNSNAHTLVQVSANGLQLKVATVIKEGQYVRMLSRDLTYVDDRKYL